MWRIAKKERCTSIKAISFNGKKMEWSPWEEKYPTMAKHKGIKSILLGTETLLTTSKVLVLGDATDPHQDDARMAIREANKLAYDDLVLSIETNTSTGRIAFFNIMKRSKYQQVSRWKCCSCLARMSEEVCTDNISDPHKTLQDLLWGQAQ
jgi:hypothetical protein